MPEGSKSSRAGTRHIFLIEVGKQKGDMEQLAKKLQEALISQTEKLKKAELICNQLRVEAQKKAEEINIKTTKNNNVTFLCAS